MTPNFKHLATGLILGLFGLLSISATTVPTFEGIDEIEHYRMMLTLADRHALPDPRERAASEYHQPPLYYVLGALVVSAVDKQDFATFDDSLNPHHGPLLTIPGNDNKNTRLHTAAEAFPYTQNGVSLAVHLLRLFSVACGVGTLLIAVRIFHELWPENETRQLLALSIVAFWPQFIYLSSVMSNDNLAILFATLVLWGLIRQLRQGLSLRQPIWLGVILGLGLLTKAYLLVLALPVGVAFGLDRRSWQYLPFTLGIVLALAGWWYVRNLLLLDSLTYTTQMFVVSGWSWNAEGSPEWGAGLRTLPNAYWNLWARFGHNALSVSPAIYRFFDTVSLAALIGLTGWFVHRAYNLKRTPPHSGMGRLALLIGLYGLVWLFALWGSASVAKIGAQGRYIFPAIVVWGMLIALGLDAWPLQRLKSGVHLGIAVGMAVVAIVCVYIYYLPAYQPRTVPSHIDHPLDYSVGNVAEIIGAKPKVTHAIPGEIVTITVYWKALRQTNVDLLSFLHSQGSDIIRRNSYPATGNLRSFDWHPGQTWAESYIIEIPADAEDQRVYPLVAGLYDPLTEQTLPALNIQGQKVQPIVGWIAIHSPLQVQDIEPAYRFGDAFGLTGTEVLVADSSVTICLNWLSLAPSGTDYQVFVHLVQDGQVLAQADGPPREGLYPTNFWIPGEVIADCHVLDVSGLTLETWWIEVGLYDLETGMRLPIIGSSGVYIVNEALRVNP